MKKDEQIESLLRKIDEKDQEIANLNNLYFSVINSKSWKFVQYIQKIKKCIKDPKIILRKFNLLKQANDVSNYLYDSEYQKNIVFDGLKTDIKSIAFYLPQFHTFKENDEWWGKGFTEWTNTRKSKPRFKNHYQPREPHEDIGYYDLSDFTTLKKQIDLAKQHGIYGFAFYYYWFSGKKLMEKPLNNLLEHPEVDFPFCLCWANENWTRTWDGQEKEILIKQDYLKDDAKNFIKDIKKFLMDKRYIKIDNKPVIMIYNPYAIPNVENVIQKWREEAKKQGIGEIYVLTRNLILDNKEEIENCDAEFDFAPLQKGFLPTILSGLKNGTAYDYENTVKEMINLYKNHNPKKTFYYCSTMGWDNSSRRKNGYNIFHHYKLESFYDWNREIIKILRDKYSKENRILFINAWNEWCEGTYLEPDKKYGYANINTLSKALFDIPFNPIKVVNDSKDKFELKQNIHIAIQIHLYHVDLTQEIIEQLNNIPFSYDCYITTDTLDKKMKIEEEFSKKSNSKKVCIDVVQNRGRDVAPFIIQMSKVYKNYDYICHIHTKKSTTVSYGNDWRKYIYRNLFGSKSNISEIFRMFEEDKNIGLIYPSVYPVIIDQTENYGRNYENCLKQFKRLGIPKQLINNKLIFPAGTMFWARVDAIKPLFEAKYSFRDFEKEEGQLDATPAHAIERLIYTIAKSRGFSYRNTFNNTLKFIPEKKNRLVLFAHYDRLGNLSTEDKEYIKELKKYAEKVIFISNSKVLTKNSKIENVDAIIENNNGYDFSAWKKAILDLGEKDLKKYDEIVLANNSSVLSNISFDEIFSYSKKNTIKALCYHTPKNKDDFEYINSDFMIFPSEILCKKEILDFFANCIECQNLVEKKKLCNQKLTMILKKLRVDLDIFINETRYINKYLVDTPIEEKHPYLMLLLRSPLLNKKSLKYANENEKIAVENFMNQIK